MKTASVILLICIMSLLLQVSHSRQADDDIDDE
jgi:hypothetical protein